MNKQLKYLLSFFLVFAMIANDGIFDSQSKSAGYYQCSVVISKEDRVFRSACLYWIKQAEAAVKFCFPGSVTCLGLKNIFSLQVKVVLKLRILLSQKINSFIEQSVFVNEILNSSYLPKCLYSA